MEFVQCSPEKEEEEDSGWRLGYVWMGFWAFSVLRKGEGKRGWLIGAAWLHCRR